LQAARLAGIRGWTGVAGRYRSLFYGYGVDFADIREYQPGTNVRYIDWNAPRAWTAPIFAKSPKDREITGYFLLDLSPSMTSAPA